MSTALAGGAFVGASEGSPLLGAVPVPVSTATPEASTRQHRFPLGSASLMHECVSSGEGPQVGGRVSVWGEDFTLLSGVIVGLANEAARGETIIVVRCCGPFPFAVVLWPFQLDMPSRG